MKKLILVATTFALMCCGCNTFQAIITICDVEDIAMQHWSKAHNDGVTSDAFDREVMKAHNNFIQVKLSTRAALEEYKNNGDKTPYLRAVAIARVAAKGVLDIVSAVVTPTEANRMSKLLVSANTIGGEP